MIAVMQKLVVLVVMREHRINLPEVADETLSYINAASSCFLIFSLVELAKVLGCRLLSLRVNAGTLFALLKVWATTPPRTSQHPSRSTTAIGFKYCYQDCLYTCADHN